MAVYQLTLPARVDTPASLRIARELIDHSDADAIMLDFGNVSWVEPFGMLYISMTIQSVRVRFPRLRVFAQKYHDQGYAIHMGFLQHCGISVGNRWRSTPGSETYSPITEIKLSELEARAFSNKTVVQDEIEAAAQKLAALLIRDPTETNLIDVVQYSIRELGRNIAEHSSSPSLLYCAQFWPTKQRIEVCIADCGVGLLETLKENPHLTIETDADAIKAAILPGISGKPISRKASYEDPWANSGFGLFMLSRLCARGGNFFLASGNNGLLISEGSEHLVEAGCQGTAVRMVMNTKEVGGLSESLQRIAAEGSAVAKEITGSETVGPSRASSMVRRVFHIKSPDE
ncbi:hypothetical protein [Hoeflea alexandrii]|uniref:STAS domain-containing protein n=2 Tax=Hoeflea alexandrii TaxID=288436 RepID=A0ABT1CN61_9HYPH|nr:hypothetical protein [Hoeflea alexandrii]MCO6407640.1 hypothetical protein [Hoeflea alexandrii]MCY0153981.1 hypothetical protein [Hoeflea alexandrii]